MDDRLLINAKWRVSPRVSGVQRYAEGLARAIDASALPARFVEPPHADRLRTTFWEQNTLTKLARNHGALLCPANSAPLQLDQDIRLLVTIHCLRFHFHPTSYSPAFVRWYRVMIPRVIERANTIFTVSQAQRTEIEGVYPAATGKIQVMSPGLDPEFHPDHERDNAVPEGAYLVAISTPAPAKNLGTLIKAYARCVDLPPLVLIGVSPREADVLCPESVRSRVHALGQIDDSTRIASILAHAQLLLAPSRYESFGLPCLEAMGCGTPVLASDIPAHREVCRSAAAFAEPVNPDAWEEQLVQILADSSRLARMRNAGLTRSRAYRWEPSLRTLERELRRGVVSVSA
ncbi:MAG: hypothetical protein CMJ35_02695 [Phycisphaerae bacterium]|nr:hypothetical protein [Phycisphaerae bacterium]MBM90507.1 hypothetical protein [Phycisphaerae bacterium]